MSSLKVAQAINERGVYCVGHLDTVVTKDTSDRKVVGSVVNLLLPPANNRESASRTYNLQNLQELQSKLALISGKQSSGQEDVDKFGQVTTLCLHSSSSKLGKNSNFILKRNQTITGTVISLGDDW